MPSIWWRCLRCRSVPWPAAQTRGCFENLLPQLEQRVTAARLLYRCGSVDVVLLESVLWISFFALRKPWDPRVRRSG